MIEFKNTVIDVHKFRLSFAEFKFISEFENISEFKVWKF